VAIRRSIATRPETDPWADVTVCRCEDVHLSDIERCLEEGAVTLQEVRLATRAGMGPCQGRLCRTALARLIAETPYPEATQATSLSVHFPTHPVRLRDLAEE